MADELLEFAREIAQRVPRHERDTWRTIFRRFANMTAEERRRFLRRLDEELLDKEHKA